MLVCSWRRNLLILLDELKSCEALQKQINFEKLDQLKQRLDTIHSLKNLQHELMLIRKTGHF